MWNARIRTLWPMGCPLTSSSIWKASDPSFSDKAPCNPFILLMLTSLGQASAHRTLHCHDSQRSPSDHGESPPRNAIHEHELLVHVPLPKPVEYLSFCVRGKLSQMGLMMVK
ncbi:hypothetical protein TNCV_4793271 [Trichonephila clavipes]|nr:hypothetical protein TNCV_4793271 [Trichonephila clavipes]